MGVENTEEAASSEPSRTAVDRAFLKSIAEISEAGSKKGDS
jgi:hypothetical protein